MLESIRLLVLILVIISEAHRVNREVSHIKGIAARMSKYRLVITIILMLAPVLHYTFELGHLAHLA